MTGGIAFAQSQPIGRDSLVAGNFMSNGKNMNSASSSVFQILVVNHKLIYCNLFRLLLYALAGVETWKHNIRTRPVDFIMLVLPNF